jgi:hypothetical protein
VQSFFSVITCPAVTHRIMAAASPITDSASVGGWTGQAVQAGPGAPLAAYTLLPNPRAANVIPASADPYDSAQRTWVFKGSQGIRLAPGAGASTVVGGAGGLSFAVWFRADDSDQRLRDLNTVLSLTLVAPGGKNLTITLTVAIWGNLHALNLRGEKCCRVGQNGGLDYQDYESDYGASGRCAAAAGRATRRAAGRAAGRECCVPPASHTVGVPRLADPACARSIIVVDRHVHPAAQQPAVRRRRVAARGLHLRRRRQACQFCVERNSSKPGAAEHCRLVGCVLASAALRLCAC